MTRLSKAFLWTSAPWLLIVTTLLVATWWWIGGQRPPVQISYCLSAGSADAQQQNCAETLILKIPRSYYGDFHQFNFDTELSMDRPQKVLVAYPSMQAWHDVSIINRSSTQKLEIEIGPRTIPDVRRDFQVHFLGNPKPLHVPTPLYGLDQYLSQPTHLWQYLIPLEDKPRTSIWCAQGSSPADDERLGCEATSYTWTGLRIRVSHKRAVLPQWADVHDKSHKLIESFVSKK